ncbi:unnamed protein product [Adineta steineri]|uniref:G-protein coupled receptors family 1 profile domain-containing protein n=1 Tax=Adineta steineri TaxID=433720 RepID=A0A813V9T0_9BILA|nr:unnamed protein product [Adineta steineri]CAF4113943.1 unnamed protein product [Adineta steineri]
MNASMMSLDTLKDSNLTIINNQAWFIPIDILLIICLTLAIILAMIFLFIVFIDSSCQTVAMILIANSCFSGLSLAVALLWSTIVTFHNDLNQIQYQDATCIMRAYFIYVTFAALCYSLLLQAIYRYIIVIYPNRLSWQSKQRQLFLICLSWIFVFLYAVPVLLKGDIRYEVDDQICQMPLHLAVITVYNSICVYFVPVSGIIFIYVKIVLYVKEMGKNVTTANSLFRAQRELKMVHRIGILISILLGLGVPYASFLFMGFFTSPPKYHYRIAYIFIDISLVFVIITLFKFTDPIKLAIRKRINRRTNVIATIMT